MEGCYGPRAEGCNTAKGTQYVALLVKPARNFVSKVRELLHVTYEQSDTPTPKSSLD